MEVTLGLKKWHVEKGKETKVPVLTGSYEILSATLGGKPIAEQDFNTEYGERKMVFSDALMKDLVTIEEKIREEIKGMLV